jgi:acyl carrier protein phosphodiesterase
MNFLAHLYLSGNDSDIMIGNFIADSVKGKLYSKYRPKVQKGILLHRKIDEFTDKHPITRELKLLLKSRYNKHSGVVIDIFYDHFLSLNWEKYSSISLKAFISNCHRVILRNIFILPPNIKSFLPVLIARGRFLSYSKIEGIKNVLYTMSKYTSLPNESDFAIEILTQHYHHFDLKFQDFFSDLIKMVTNELKKESELIQPG